MELRCAERVISSGGFQHAILVWDITLLASPGWVLPRTEIKSVTYTYNVCRLVTENGKP